MSTLPPAEPAVKAEETDLVRALESAQQTVEEHFPGLWPAVAVGLSACATLLLKDNANPTAIIYVGGPGSSKTTVVELFAGHPQCYLSDNFTPAAFVSHAASVPRQALANVDLLPRIQHKVLLTPELAILFRGKEDELTKRFSIITRVLDGQGLQTDSGTHGQRGYRGDYLFAWLGCTTPLDRGVWRVMAQLGSRLFFWAMDDQEVGESDLLAADEGPPYRENVERCRDDVQAFLSVLFATYGGVRSVRWDRKADPKPIRTWIAKLASLLAASRSDGQIPENPRRAYAVLSNLARGHAMIHDRHALAEADLPLVAHVAVSTMPTPSRAILLALVRSGRRTLKAKAAAAALGYRKPDSARDALQRLNEGRIFKYVERGTGKPSYVRLRRRWAWCETPDCRDLLLNRRPPTKNPGVCASPPAQPQDLAQRHSDCVVTVPSTHPPDNGRCGLNGRLSPPPPVGGQGA